MRKRRGNRAAGRYGTSVEIKSGAAVLIEGLGVLAYSEAKVGSNGKRKLDREKRASKLRPG